MDKLITVVIPTYNEKDNITPLVERVHDTLSAYSYEILFVDDNSRDGTAQLISTLSAKYPVQVIVRLKERGLASAVVHGFKYAKGEIIAVMDADLQHPPQVLADLLEAIEAGADLVIASRYVKGGGCQGWGLVRRIISKGAIFLAHLVLPQTRRISDPASGFFMLRKQVVDGANLRPTGYKILLEVLLEGHFQKVAEVPYIFRVRERGESKLNARQQIDYLKHLYSLMRRAGELVRFLKFCVVGASGVLVNLGSYWLITRFLHLNQFAALAISFEASVVSNFLFNNFFTFSDRRVSKPLPLLVQFVKFNFVSLAGLGIQEGALWLLNSVLNVNDIIAVLIGIILATLWNYMLNTWWTWK
ncbi:MAG TPA: glycosyltransferase family 2 protein [Dehalococcoidales bacterium]